MARVNSTHNTVNNRSSSRAPTRRAWLRAVGTASIGLLAGCADGGSTGNTGNGKGTVIEYWRWPHSTQPSNEAETAIVEAFNKKDNGIRVEQVRTPYQDYPTKLKSAIGSNNAPAVGWNLAPGNLYETAGRTREDIANNAPYVYLDDWLDDSFKDQFWETLWVRQYSDYKGIVTLPFVGGIDPGLIYVNVDAWNKAGLGEMPKESWSITEFHRAIEALNGVEYNGNPLNGWGIGLKDINNRNRWVETIHKARTFGKIIGEGFQNQNGAYTLTMTDQAMVDAWDAWYQTPIDNGWTTSPFAYTKHESLKQFYNGQDAMGLHFTWGRAGVAKNADFEWDILPMPTKGGNDYWTRETSSAGMSAFKESVGGNPEAATKFMQFRTKAENAFKFFNVSGQGVPNKKAYQMMKKQKGELSEFVKKSRAMSVMDAMNDAYGELKNLSNRRKKRYPSIKSTKVQGISIVEQSIPRGAGGGQLQQQTGNQLQRIIKGKPIKQGYIDIEKAWQQTLSASDYEVDTSSVGYNKPAPGYSYK